MAALDRGVVSKVRMVRRYLHLSTPVPVHLPGLLARQRRRTVISSASLHLDKPRSFVDRMTNLYCAPLQRGPARRAAHDHVVLGGKPPVRIAADLHRVGAPNSTGDVVRQDLMPWQS